jgi:hypothetical protein
MTRLRAAVLLGGIGYVVLVLVLYVRGAVVPAAFLTTPVGPSPGESHWRSRSLFRSNCSTTRCFRGQVIWNKLSTDDHHGSRPRDRVDDEERDSRGFSTNA